MKTEKLHQSHPLFNIKETERIGDFNCFLTIINGFKIKDTCTFKPDRSLKNPVWFIQKMVNW